MTRRFARTIEDFTCMHCGFQVVGNGYTNHCPRCLWSKHVDVQPGDRAEACLGPMRPRSIETSSKGIRIVHLCETCGASRRVKMLSSDSMETVLEVMREHQKVELFG